jgi:SAM-dependent MidA family methyltransferase
MTVADTLRQRIVAGGPIPFEVFMDIALYGQGGFFASGPLRSSATGDFLTSPEVSPWFGKTIGRFLATRISADGNIVEVGGGSGSLLTPLLAELPDTVTVWAVEASPMARDRLTGILSADHVVSALTDLPTGFSGAIIANELIDNLPVALAVRAGDGWVEHSVGLEDDVFAFVETPVRAEVAAWADVHGGVVPEGGIVEVQLAAAAWLRQAIELVSGVVVLIDYGGTTEELEPRRQLGTLRTYRGHHLGPDPLLEPGETDITVDVNFSALAAVAEAAGAKVSLHRQDDFLAEWGLRQAVSDMRQLELEHARSGDTMAQLATKSERVDAQTLLHPRGLGDFRVLAIETG